MKCRSRFLSLTLGLALGMSGGKASAQSCAETDLRDFLESGGYELGVAQVALAGQLFLRRAAKAYPGDSLALVLDLDDTALTNTAILDEDAFCFNDARMIAYWRGEGPPPLVPIRDLFDLARSLNIAVFFISGRRTAMRDVAEQNLADAGYEGYEALVLRPIIFFGSTEEFKSDARRDIVARGYRIVLNVGDQLSDIAGGVTDQALLLPNPFYFVP